jgi:hypothetical protein
MPGKINKKTIKQEEKNEKVLDSVTITHADRGLYPAGMCSGREVQRFVLRAGHL